MKVVIEDTIRAEYKRCMLNYEISVECSSVEVKDCIATVGLKITIIASKKQSKKRGKA